MWAADVDFELKRWANLASLANTKGLEVNENGIHVIGPTVHKHTGWPGVTSWARRVEILMPYVYPTVVMT